MIEAVIFDLDGVIVDSEPVWEDVLVRRTRLTTRDASAGTVTASAGSAGE